MTNAKSDSVVDAAYYLLVTLLHDGQKSTQSTFLEIVQESREEEFFGGIASRLQTSMANIKEARLLATMKIAQQNHDLYVFIYFFSSRNSLLICFQPKSNHSFKFSPEER